MKMNEYILLFLILFLWKLIYKYSCIALVFILMIPGINAYYFYNIGMHKKIFTANYYFNKNSIVYRIYIGKYLTVIMSIFYSIFISVIFCLSVLFFNLLEFTILIIDALILELLYSKIINTNIFNKNYASMMGISTSAKINTGLLLIAFLVLNLYSPVPSYITESLRNTIINFSTQTGSACDLINILVKINAEFEGIKWWCMINLDAIFKKDKAISVILWLLFLLKSGLGFYCYSIFILAGKRLIRYSSFSSQKSINS